MGAWGRAGVLLLYRLQEPLPGARCSAQPCPATLNWTGDRKRPRPVQPPSRPACH